MKYIKNRRSHESFPTIDKLALRRNLFKTVVFNSLWQLWLHFIWYIDSDLLSYRFRVFNQNCVSFERNSCCLHDRLIYCRNILELVIAASHFLIWKSIVRTKQILGRYLLLGSAHSNLQLWRHFIQFFKDDFLCIFFGFGSNSFRILFGFAIRYVILKYGERTRD